MSVPSTDDPIDLDRPGQIIQEELLEPLGITAYRLAKGIGLSQTAVSEVLRGDRKIPASTGLLLDKFFGFTPGYWLGMQADYDTHMARRVLGSKLDAVQPFPRPDIDRAA